MSLDLTPVLVEAVLEDHQRMVKLDIHACAEGALLELREDMSVQNRPVRMQCQRVKLLKVLVLLAATARVARATGCDFGQSDQFSKSHISLLPAFLIRVGVGERAEDLIVEILVEAIEVLLYKVQLAAAQLKLQELVMLFVLLDPRLGTGPFHGEVEHEHGHLEHILTLLGHGLARQDLARAYVLILEVCLLRVECVWILGVIKYLKRLHDQMMRIVVEKHIVVKTEVVANSGKDWI